MIYKIEKFDNNLIMCLINKEPQAVTKAICNKGFSGNSNILPRSNFGVDEQVTASQSLTAYSLDRQTV